MIRPIVLYNTSHPILNESTLIVDIDNERDKTVSIINDLTDTLKWVGGLGLSANQISVKQRICVVKLNDDIIPMINPKIIHHSGSVDSVEACLSLPDIVVSVKRYLSIRVSYIDPAGFIEKELEVDFPNSVIIQHEIDHLDGKTIIDDITPMQRNLLSNKLKRIIRGTIPINYVGLSWKSSIKSWVIVGNPYKILEMNNYMRTNNTERL